MGKLLIKGGRIVTAADDYAADLLAEGGRVRVIAEVIAPEADMEVHDATGLLVLPGGVDVHTHLEGAIAGAKTADTVESATRAAAFGGTTTVLDYARQPPGETPQAGFAEWREKAARACVDVGTHMILTSCDDTILAGIRVLADTEGVTSFKVFMVFAGGTGIDDAGLMAIMERAAEAGALTCVHAENGPVVAAGIRREVEAGNTHPRYHAVSRPPAAEAEATTRAIRLAGMAGTPVFVAHVSAAGAVEAIARGRDRGQAVFGETCPHYLFLDQSAYEAEGFEAAKYVMSPPLRSPGDQAALWRGLRLGHLQAVSTDHCPFNFSAATRGREHSKEMGSDSFAKIPNGAPGIETRMALLFDGGVRTGRLGLNRFVELTATGPARLFGLYPRKGTLAVGSDADILLFDADETWTVRAEAHHSDVDYSLFEGRELTGRVRKVFLRGHCIVDGDQWLGRPGMGEYQARRASGKS